MLGSFQLVLILFFVLHSAGFAQENLYELKSGHPRIIMTKYGELALRFTVEEDPLAINLQNELKKDADKLLNGKEIKYSLDQNKSMLGISREYLKRILTLSLAYRMFEDDKYADKAIAHMMHVCTFPNWNPEYFLDVAEMTTALAIGYDWNYYHLDREERETIRNRIVEFGLMPGLDVYENPGDKPHNWYEMKDNWSQVCAGGLILGALAVGEDFPDLSKKIIFQALKNLMPTLKLYEPDGVWNEGPEYWEYANTYLAMTISSLETALEHDFALSTLPGIDKTADYYFKTISANDELFNAADSENANRLMNPALFWFSKKYQLPDITAYYIGNLEKNVLPGSPEYSKGRGRFFYMSLPWFNEEIYE